MILQSEILKIAEVEGVPPDTIDKNWVLGHFLAELYKAEWARNYLIFKGGTCLKKCYFPDYRFSEDLDFTLNKADFQITNKLLQSVCDTISAQTGILFSKVKIDALTWENNQVGYATHIRFWGANHRKNQQPPDSDRWHTAIKIEIVFYELLVNISENRPLYSDYSDNKIFENTIIPCYSISEMAAEKFRALLQRSYPAPRDYYDLWYLLKQKEIDRDRIVETFKLKATFKNIKFNNYDNFFDSQQIKKVKQAWQNSLKQHLSEEKFPDVTVAIEELRDICSKINW